MRTNLLVFTVFLVDGQSGTGGILQAAFALVILLFSMVAHAFVQPYKDPRSNSLETKCLLANIMMLFLGMIGAMGTLPNQGAAYILEALGYALGTVCS